MAWTVSVPKGAQLADIAEAVLACGPGAAVTLVIDVYTLVRACWDWQIPLDHSDSIVSRAKRGELTLAGATVVLADTYIERALVRLVEW